MDLKQKLALEIADSENIYLYREGLFWKAYERSAIKFVQTITAYQVNTRYCKAVKMDVISLGFPDTVLSKVLENNTYEQTDEKQIILRSVILEEEEFQTAKSKYVCKTLPETDKSEEEGKQVVDPGISVLERLRRYDVAGVTPVDCMIFLLSLKKELENSKY